MKRINCGEYTTTCDPSDYKCVDFSPDLCKPVPKPSAPKPVEKIAIEKITEQKVVNKVSVPTATIVKHVTDIVHTPAPPVVHDVLTYKVKRAHYDLVKEVVPAKPGPFIKIVKYRSPAPPGPVKVVYVPKPVPVPVPVPAPSPKKLKCSIDVKSCFAHIKTDFKDPRLLEPLNHFRGSYHSICADEHAQKEAASEKRRKTERRNKELCVKRDNNIKFNENKLKLTTKKEKASKRVAESKDKFLEKKVKSVEEATTKAIGVSREKNQKLNEGANKREDVLYKQECASKEAAYKEVRESKQKIKVVYVARTKTRTVAALPPPPPPYVIVSKTVTYTPAPQPVPQTKTTIYVPAPVTATRVASFDPAKEVQFKSTERLNKADAASTEKVSKQDTTSKEIVGKEATSKQHHISSSEISEKRKAEKEKRCKEQESKESKAKAEIEQKVAVEKVRKELTKKELAGKKLHRQVVTKPCKPASSVEAYVKSCKFHEEKFAKSKVEAERNMKEVKAKAKSDLEETACDFSRKVCQRIYQVSTVHEENIVDMVNDHTTKLEAAMAAVDNSIADEAKKEQHNICQQAAQDMKYFAKKFMFSKTEGAGAPALLVQLGLA